MKALVIRNLPSVDPLFQIAWIKSIDIGTLAQLKTKLRYSQQKGVTRIEILEKLKIDSKSFKPGTVKVNYKL